MDVSDPMTTTDFSPIDDIGLGRLLENDGKWFKDLMNRIRRIIYTTADIYAGNGNSVPMNQEKEDTTHDEGDDGTRVEGEETDIVFDAEDITGFVLTENGDEILGF